MELVNNIVEKWFSNHEKLDNSEYRKKIKDLAVNCVSLSNAFFSKDTNKNVKKSYSLLLLSKKDGETETLYGINELNLPETILAIITDKPTVYSKVILNCYYHINGERISKQMGEIEIS